METTHTTTRPNNTTGDAIGTSAQRSAAWKLCEGRCPICARRMHTGGSDRKSRLTIDHVAAWSAGGSNGAGNLLPLCGSCNSSKCDRDLALWLPGRLVSTKRASTLRGANRMIAREMTRLAALVVSYSHIMETI